MMQKYRLVQAVDRQQSFKPTLEQTGDAKSLLNPLFDLVGKPKQRT